LLIDFWAESEKSNKQILARVKFIFFIINILKLFLKEGLGLFDVSC